MSKLLEIKRVLQRDVILYVYNFPNYYYNYFFFNTLGGSRMKKKIFIYTALGKNSL